MSHTPTPHISDSELLRSADGETSVRRDSEIQAHLISCWSCRARRARLENTISEFIQRYEHESDAAIPPIEPARFRFEARLAELRGSARQSLWDRLSFIFDFRRMAFIGGGIALALLYFIWANVGTPPLQAALVPDIQLTPGATRQVTRADICAPVMTGPSTNALTIPSTVAHRVFEEYGIHNPSPRAYEVDYLITPALGGSSDIHNLWPQPYAAGVWNSHAKDALEERLRTLVCDGSLDLPTAQQEIAANWIAAYKKYFRTREPLEIHAGFAIDPPWE